jgi:murein DD-endopeptidase MepM/ murein hydrolase activator NlpD
MRGSKQRNGRRRLGHIVLPVLVAVLCFLLLRQWNEHQRTAKLSPQDTTYVREAAAPGLRSHCDTLKPGVSLHASLLKTDVSIDQITSFLGELGNVLDLKKLMPGESYELITDEQDSVRMLRYVKAPGEVFVVEPVEEGLTVFQENIPLTKIIRKLEGTIDVSLYDAVCESGGDAELAVLLSEIFAWDIDFFTDPRKGDRFSFLVEQYMRGEYPRGYGKILAARYDGKEITRDAFLYVVSDGKHGYFDTTGKSLRRAFLRSPLNYRRITSYFTNRRFHPILKRYRAHHGIDYAARNGTPVVAIGDGTVTYGGWKGGYGRFVSIRHNSQYTSTYGHLSGFGKGIRRGARVAQGQIVGYVGSSGLSTGPHLDFRMTRGGSFINPLRLEIPPLASVPQADMDAFVQHRTTLARALDSMSPSGEMEVLEFERRFFPDTLLSGLAYDARF